MSRIIVTRALAVVAIAALFAALVHAVLVSVQLGQPAADTVPGLTLRRLWASGAALLALLGSGIGAWALARPTSWAGAASGRVGGLVALAAGVTAVANGGLNLAVATGGPGSGNGVVGAAAAIVLGMVALVLSGVVLRRAG